MGQFKPMVKMMTTEPTVELKLKKGGKVTKKADGGMMGSPMSATDIPPAMPARGGMMGAAAPMKPSLAMRRRAMRGMPAGAGPAGPVGGAATMPAPGGMPGMKKGGKTKHDDAAQDRAMIKKAMAGKKFATGGAIPSETTSGTPATTIMHQAKPDNAPARTGGVKNGNGGGFKKGGMTKKMATGGVVKGQAGYATGGAIPSETTSGSYATTKMHQAKPDNSPAKTGGVKNGNGGGYKKGGKIPKMALGGIMGQLGGMPMPIEGKGGDYGGGGGDATSGLQSVNKGASTIGGALKNIAGSVGSGNSGPPEGAMYKRGGKASKKAYAAGGTVDSGRPVAMPQGRKPAAKPVRINELAGVYKAGGKVTPAQGRLQKISDVENAPSFQAAKMDSNEKYGPASQMKLKRGGRAC